MTGALVTGGARRVGRAIVEDLAANGHAVAIHCNSGVSEAEALAAEIVARGGTAVVVPADLSRETEARGLIKQAGTALDRPVQLVVNNASVFERDEVGTFSTEVFDRHFAIHVKAPALIVQEFAARLPRDHDGLVVNVIDQRVLKPVPGFFSYGLSKSALHAATVTMAQALAPRIRVNAIGPGPTLPNSRQSEADFAAQVDGLILGRGPELGEFGATIRYLWEARSVTGQMIALDGGQHLAWQTPDVAGLRE
ncbi:MAG: SDR family oxidoreductase [Rhizobiaceae bacterium]|nr:SDR family oxidoreductase [Rhizobiaceae bacterium]MCV0406471.1 SDR family oxidoreductase [Rhizobiaceae bacterium]